MTVISSPATNPAAALSAPSVTRSDGATLSADFETFLQMLTTQAKYQDPLEPVSSSEYAAQLAQFSMVEQQVFTNEQLEQLSNALGGNAINTLADWVGLEARAVASASFTGPPVTVLTAPAPTADQAQLVVFDDAGREVARRDIPVTGGDYEWDGKDQSGTQLPTGSYSFVVESRDDDAVIGSEPAQIYARVVEAQLVDGETMLKLESGSLVSSGQVTALREPST